MTILHKIIKAAELLLTSVARVPQSCLNKNLQRPFHGRIGLAGTGRAVQNLIERNIREGNRRLGSGRDG